MNRAFPKTEEYVVDRVEPYCQYIHGIRNDPKDQ